MSRTRFGLLVALVAVVAGVGSFVGGVALLDDEGPDEPPGGEPDLVTGDSTTSSTSTSTSTTAPTAPGQLSTPAWVAVVSSERDEAAAQAVAEQVANAGFDTGVLHSDDHESLSPGFWVAYTGPFEDRSGAGQAVERLADRGFDGAYARCVGTDAQCGGGGDDSGRGGDEGAGADDEDD